MPHSILALINAAWTALTAPSASPIGFVAVGGLGLVGALVLTPLVIRWARRIGWIDRPSPERWHTRPTALMGGIALVGAIALGLGVSGAWAALPWPVWAGALLLAGTGLADDRYGLNPETKFLAQVIAAVLVLYAGLAFWRGGPAWASVPLTFLWVIGITNAVNLIDGMDGLAGGVAAIAASALGVIAWELGLPNLAAVAAVVVGATAGFLVFNFQPARIFMGDGGSMPLGFLLAVLAMGAQGRGGPVVATLVPIVVLAVPIFDTTFVTVTRILRGESVTEGGLDHTMHRLVLLGLSERHAVLVLHAVSAGFGLLAVAVYWSSLQLFLALGLLALVAAVVVGLYLASAQAYPGLSTPNGDSPGSGPEGSLTVPSTQRLGAVMRALVGSPYWKSAVGVVADVLLVAGAFVVAHHLRFEAGLPADHMATMLQVLPAVVGVKVLVFYAFNLYHGIWRHAGTPEIVRLAAATALASVLVGAGLAFMGPEAVSVSVLVIDWMVTTAAVGGVRFGFRALRQYFAAQRDGGRRVAIYGAGSTGQLALRHLRQTPSARRTAVGFLDDSPDRQGLMLQGLTVLGTPDDLGAIQAEYDLDEVVVPAADLTEAQRRRIRDRCAEVGLPCRVFSLRFRRPDEEGFDMPPVTDRGDGASRPVEESS